MSTIHRVNILPQVNSSFTFSTLLALDHVRYVDIAGTPMASGSRKDFFDTLTEDAFGKLIFIGQIWLPGLNWHSLISEKYRTLVYETHEKYFSGQCGKPHLNTHLLM